MKYSFEQRRCISFPLGGIGTGSVGLSGAGALIDWEIFNAPNKFGGDGFNHFAIKTERNGQLLDLRLLQGDYQGDYAGTVMPGNDGNTCNGFGHGANRRTLPGMPHFRDLEFNAVYPLAQLNFSDPHFPGTVVETAFNPLIPLNDFDSSLPAAAFEFTVANTACEELDYAIIFCCCNPSPESCNRFIGKQLQLNQLAITSDAPEISAMSNWCRGGWMDYPTMYWHDLAKPGPLPDRRYDTPGHYDHGALAGHLHLKPGTSGRIRFVLSWYFPERRNDWHPAAKELSGWKNYYATCFSDAADVGNYFMNNFDRLLTESRTFVDALQNSTLPMEILDALSANLAILKSPTVMRLEHGEFYGFEGSDARGGSCEGSCTHVWNYAYALPFLFPALERSMHELNYTYNWRPDGGLCFRLQLPPGTPPADFRACVDGQLGDIILICREWKISGDDEWLHRWYPSARRALEYVWSSDNPDRWDPAASGSLTGRQHHTLDKELFGPSAWLCGIYLAALLAMEEISLAIGESDYARRCRMIFEQGRRKLEEELYNGEYYIQKIDLHDPEILREFPGATEEYWNAETGEIKYQIGNGCAIDQLLGDWHGALCGLPPVFQPDHLQSALTAIYRYNFQPSLREFPNVWRVYGLNDEAGTVICSWPHHDMPTLPLPYYSETMHGFEYQFAAMLLMHGEVEKGLEVVRAVRSRYDGTRRNPWNEMECGSNYARSMASYALLNAWSGFSFHMARHEIGFAPVVSGDFRTFWSTGTGWGTYEETADRLELKLHYGTLRLERFRRDLAIRAIRHNELAVTLPVTLKPGDKLTFLRDQSAGNLPPQSDSMRERTSQE